jgi:hypothetical protein
MQVLFQKRQNDKTKKIVSVFYGIHTWQHTLFSDEFRFSLRFSNERVNRRCGEGLMDQCVHESDRFGGESGLGWNYQKEPLVQ